MGTSALLLVDDEALVQEVLRVELAEAGFEIVVVGDGTQALAEPDADATRFRAVITDMRPGEGPDGWDAGRRARELVSDMPVIYMPVVYMAGDSARAAHYRGLDADHRRRHPPHRMSAAGRSDLP